MRSDHQFSQHFIDSRYSLWRKEPSLHFTRTSVAFIDVSKGEEKKIYNNNTTTTTTDAKAGE